jgi:beta-glucosidase
VEQPANSPQQTTFSGVTYPVQVDCTPTVVYTDGPDGVRSPVGVTAFPAPIALASTWNADLVEQKGANQAAEAFDMRRNVVLGPGLAGGRTPLSGRTPEYVGEDPVLSGVLTAAAVNGIQDGNPDKPVLANLKHYVANEQELDRQTSSSNIDPRTLREIYNLPFEIAVDRSAPESVMCSYNQINGAYSCENPLLNELLKGEAGFDGYVMSDFGAVHTTAASLANGMDQELNRPRFLTPANLDAALAARQVTQAQIDAAAFRVVRSYIRGGLFDHPLPATAAVDASTADHKATAREASEQGSVLLQNDGVLPLAPAAGEKIALIGPTASSTVTTIPGTNPPVTISASNVCSMTNRGNNALRCEDLVSPEAGIRDRAAQVGATVTWNNGQDLASAAAAAADADVVVVFGYQRMGEFTDVPDLHLQGNGDQLIQAVAAANPNTVAVLQTGSAVEMPWAGQVRAVLENWYGGEQMGPALAALLFGDVDPSGKLPMTFPVSLADTPTAQSPQRYPGTFANGSTTRPTGSTEIRQVQFSEGLKVGYRWYQSQGIDPLFAFGHGLSYTEFEYSHLQTTPTTTDGKKEIRINFRLTNTGDREGTEVAQAYIALPSSAGEPSKRLVGWQRVTLQPGEHKNVTITLSPADLQDLRLLQYWDAGTHSWATPRGTFQVSVGGSSQTALADSFRIK